MAKSPHWAWPLFVLLVGSVAEVCGQQDGDRPEPFVPARSESRHELKHREARKLYAEALICQREDRVVEAMRLYEKAVQLDPESPILHRALVPIYLALGKVDDGLAECKKTLALDPGDHATWCLYARQLREMGEAKEA